MSRRLPRFPRLPWKRDQSIITSLGCEGSRVLSRKKLDLLQESADVRRKCAYRGQRCSQADALRRDGSKCRNRQRSKFTESESDCRNSNQPQPHQQQVHQTPVEPGQTHAAEQALRSGGMMDEPMMNESSRLRPLPPLNSALSCGAFSILLRLASARSSLHGIRVASAARRRSPVFRSCSMLSELLARSSAVGTQPLSDFLLAVGRPSARQTAGKQPSGSTAARR